MISLGKKKNVAGYQIEPVFIRVYKTTKTRCYVQDFSQCQPVIAREIKNPLDWRGQRSTQLSEWCQGTVASMYGNWDVRCCMSTAKPPIKARRVGRKPTVNCNPFYRGASQGEKGPDNQSLGCFLPGVRFFFPIRFRLFNQLQTFYAGRVGRALLGMSPPLLREVGSSKIRFSAGAIELLPTSQNLIAKIHSWDT